MENYLKFIDKISKPSISADFGFREEFGNSGNCAGIASTVEDKYLPLIYWHGYGKLSIDPKLD